MEQAGKGADGSPDVYTGLIENVAAHVRPGLTSYWQEMAGIRMTWNEVKRKAQDRSRWRTSVDAHYPPPRGQRTLSQSLSAALAMRVGDRVMATVVATVSKQATVDCGHCLNATANEKFSPAYTIGATVTLQQRIFIAQLHSLVSIETVT
uniref:SFRICE_024350 n=1 Tax=Spodoptera frugiperda TaxID=7108 RepID=A0A2H1V1T5_SPOFR